MRAASSHIRHRSLLGPLLGAYLIFVIVVLGAGSAATLYVRGQLQAQMQSADLALAQAIALELDNKISDARAALEELALLDELRSGDPVVIAQVFRAFKAARQDIDSVYWLDADGLLRVSVPSSPRTEGIDYSEERIFQGVLRSGMLQIEAGVVDLTTFNPVAVLGHPVYAEDGGFLGVVATNLLLDELSAPLQTIVAAQDQRLEIQVLNGDGLLIASSDRARLLQPLLAELSGAVDALSGRPATSLSAGRDGGMWLFSAEPVLAVGWAVVVQRHSADAFAAISDFNRWLSGLALLFAGGFCFFWLLLHARVIRPLRAIARHNRHMPIEAMLPDIVALPLMRRDDEVGALARSLRELRRSIVRRLAELQTLLETSTAVVSSLDPTDVARRIIVAVRQLVDVQAAALLVPDEQGVLKVLLHHGHTGHERRQLLIPPDNPHSPSALALREGRPVQLIADIDPHFPPISYDEGFRALLAVPIIGAHVGGVVLVVYRRAPCAFTPEEIDLLLTFANHATLAWEHAVLYERSDERLQSVAAENARLYHEAAQERQVLAAIMRSMDDGLVLASEDGTIIYANRGTGALLECESEALLGRPISDIHHNLAARAATPQTEISLVNRVHAIQRGDQRCWIQLREFDVRADGGQMIGRGLLLRDVTTEHELDQFKTTLLGAVGHELRTPLAAIKGHASTLLQPDVRWSEADQRHFLRTINDEADRLTRLTRSLLDLARVDAGLLDLARESWRLTDLLTPVLHRHGTAAARVHLDIPAELPALHVDPQRIEVVLDNLIGNALRYGGDRIAVRAWCAAGQVHVCVADNGDAITPDELPYVFQRFYRSGRTSHRHTAGTGLGLAICRAFVEAHGGRIRAERSQDETIFHLTLPAVGDFAPVMVAVQDFETQNAEI
ncbi:MAG: GAF domain-containing protein [Oscillochloris sp.]|nr:GAF domain-containing protein [Oscillochloris sp.]